MYQCDFKTSNKFKLKIVNIFTLVKKDTIYFLLLLVFVYNNFYILILKKKTYIINKSLILFLYLLNSSLYNQIHHPWLHVQGKRRYRKHNVDLRKIQHKIHYSWGTAKGCDLGGNNINVKTSV